MRRLKTILTEIYKDELELMKYPKKDIENAIDEIEKNYIEKHNRTTNSTLLNVIYTDESRE